jgi:UDP-3-O-[3-hydroxymyristoyl] glucosamine N-acyltransferase
LDILASPGIVVIDRANGAGVRVAVGVEVGSGVGVGVGVEAAVGLEVGSGVGVGVGVGVAVGVEVGSGVGVGVGVGFTDRLQLSVRKPTSRSKDARKQLLRFRSMVKNSFKTPSTLDQRSRNGQIGLFFPFGHPQHVPRVRNTQ